MRWRRPARSRPGSWVRRPRSGSRPRSSGSEDKLDAREDNYVADAFSRLVSGDVLNDGVSLAETHVLLGLSSMALGLPRVIWRAGAGLPPWADHFGPGERRLEAWLEKILLKLLFLVPGTGLLLIAAKGDWLLLLLLLLHLAAQMALLAAIVVHVGLVLKHTVIQRDRHLRRML